MIGMGVVESWVPARYHGWAWMLLNISGLISGYNNIRVSWVWWIHILMQNCSIICTSGSNNVGSNHSRICVATLLESVQFLFITGQVNSPTSWYLVFTFRMWTAIFLRGVHHGCFASEQTNKKARSCAFPPKEQIRDHHSRIICESLLTLVVNGFDIEITVVFDRVYQLRCWWSR